jgi:hypothetical protein
VHACVGFPNSKGGNSRMVTFILGLVLGAVVTGVCFVVFAKNNQNSINKLRSEILQAYESGGESSLKSFVEKMKN